MSALADSAPAPKKNIVDKLKTNEEARELFLWKYRDVSREDVNALLEVNDILFDLGFYYYLYD